MKLYKKNQLKKEYKYTQVNSSQPSKSMTGHETEIIS
jgi:hypothetical protein